MADYRESVELKLLETERLLADHVLLAAHAMERAHEEQVLRDAAEQQAAAAERRMREAEQQRYESIALQRAATPVPAPSVADHAGLEMSYNLSTPELYEELRLCYRVLSDLELSLFAAEQRCRELEKRQ